jgi:hypothetical protein
LRPVFDELFRWANAHARPEPDAEAANAAGKGDDKLP